MLAGLTVSWVSADGTSGGGMGVVGARPSAGTGGATSLPLFNTQMPTRISDTRILGRRRSSRSSI